MDVPVLSEIQNITDPKKKRKKAEQVKSTDKGFVIVQFLADGIIHKCRRRNLKNINSQTNSCTAKWGNGRYYEAIILKDPKKQTNTSEDNFKKTEEITISTNANDENRNPNKVAYFNSVTENNENDVEKLSDICKEKTDAKSDDFDKNNMKNAGSESTKFINSSNDENLFEQAKKVSEMKMKANINATAIDHYRLINSPVENFTSEILLTNFDGNNENNTDGESNVLAVDSKKLINSPKNTLFDENATKNVDIEPYGTAINRSNELISLIENCNGGINPVTVIQNEEICTNDDQEKQKKCFVRCLRPRETNNAVFVNDKYHDVEFSENDSFDDCSDSDEWTPPKKEMTALEKLNFGNSNKNKTLVIASNSNSKFSDSDDSISSSEGKRALEKLNGFASRSSSPSSSECENSSSISPVIPFIKNDGTTTLSTSNEKVQTQTLMYNIRVNQKTKIEKMWNKKQYCKYCLKSVQKLPRHLAQKHKNESEVKDFVKLSVQNPKRKQIIKQLRNQGNFIHNRMVLTKGEGELHTKRQVPFYKSSDRTFDQYISCNICQAAVLSKYLAQHRKISHLEISKQKENNDNYEYRKQSRMLLPIPIAVSEKFKNNVLSIMKRDKIKNIVQSDELIVQLGERMYNKIENVGQKTDYYISQKIREMGRLLQEIRIVTNNEYRSLKSSLKAKEMNNLILAVKRLGQFDEDKREFGKPTLVTVCGHSIRKIVFSAIGLASERSDEEFKDSLKSFLDAFNARWTDEISSIAVRNIRKKRWNKPKLLPLTKDITKFTIYLQDQIKIFLPVARDSPDKKVLFKLSRLLLCLLICFNRRRSGEVEQIEVKDAENAFIGDVNSDVMKYLDLHEQHLASVLSRFETRGKRGKVVPVLLTALMRNCIEILCKASNRVIMEICPENNHIFAISNSKNGYINACKELRLHSRSCGLENPDLLRSTKLRKHLAVMTQLINIDQNELDVLARFMGHNIDVHRDYYRLPDHTMDLAKISKHLISKNKGIDTREFSVDENALIESESEQDDLDPINDENNDQTFVDYTPARNTFSGTSQKNTHLQELQKPPEELKVLETPIIVNENHESFSSDVPPKKLRKKVQSNQTASKDNLHSLSKKSCVRQRWSLEELNVLKTYFINYVNCTFLPGKAEFERCKEKYPVLGNRTWRCLKDRLRQLQLMNTKKK